MIGFVIGSILGTLGGSWVYHAARRVPLGQLSAAILSGASVAFVDSVAYILLGVHSWVAGPGAAWGVSVFLAVCMGITYGALCRGQPLAPRS